KEFPEPKKDAKDEAKNKNALPNAETFRYPSPVDLTKKDLAAYKPPVDPKEAAKKKAEEAKQKAEDERKKNDPKEIAKRAEEKKKAEEEKKKEPLMTGIAVATVEQLPPDGDWRHISFTYDGFGKAA